MTEHGELRRIRADLDAGHGYKQKDGESVYQLVMRIACDVGHAENLRDQAEAERDRLWYALIECVAAINPEDRDGISLHIWNQRLKTATDKAATVIAESIAREDTDNG